MPSTIYVPIDTRNRSSGTPADCRIQLDHPIIGYIKDISLLSIELPYSFYTIRSPYNRLTLNGVTQTINEGEWTLSDLLSTIRTIYPSLGLTLTDNTTTGKITMTSTTTVTVTINSPQDIMSILGFTSGQSGTSIIGNLSYDTYVNVVISNIPSNTISRNPSHFRIPLNTTQGSVFYLQQNSTFVQKLDVHGHYNLTSLSISLRDRFNNTLNMNGIDYSILLEVNLY